MRVVFNELIRPKYLIGLTGTVRVDLRPLEDRVQVELDEPEQAGRFASWPLLCVLAATINREEAP